MLERATITNYERAPESGPSSIGSFVRRAGLVAKCNLRPLRAQSVQNSAYCANVLKNSAATQMFVQRYVLWLHETMLS